MKPAITASSPGTRRYAAGLPRASDSRSSTPLRQRSSFIQLALFMAGCSATYERSDVVSASSKLNPDRGVLVSTPEDGQYGAARYFGSGNMTAAAVRSAFSKYATRADFAKKCHGEECLEQVDTKKYGYYVKPEILHWEERATEWSGLPDKIEIQVVVYDAETKRQLANTSYTGKSKWATFGGDHPQDLLAEPTNEFVGSLYR